MKNRTIDTVFLCRSPLQARICLHIIEHNKLKNFDVIYTTQDNNDLDKSYYSMLSSKANFSTYVYVTKKSRDIYNHLSGLMKVKRKWPKTIYNNIYIASIDNYIFRYIIKQNPKATLFGFDDGAANISEFGHYYHLNAYKKAILYSWLLRLPQPQTIKERLSKHYTIYEGFKNIVPKDKLITLQVFDSKSSSSNPSDRALTFFIGQPFHEYLNSKELSILLNWLESQSIDYYVMHPREQKPLIDNIKVLDKKGLLAEDAIFKNSKDSRTKIISAYSTVLFNIPPDSAEKIYLSLSNNSAEQERRRLIKRTGSKIIKIF